MQGKSHLYFLLDSMNRSLYREGAAVKTSAVPRPIVFSPDGWTNIEINNQRNTKYFALDRSFSTPLEFVEDGAMILKDAYYKKGVEVKVYLVILKQKLMLERDGSGNITGYGFYYDSFYRGEIDFSNFQDAGTKVTVNIMEGGIPKAIKANENTKYEIPVDVPEAVSIKMDGIRLLQSATFIITNGTPPDNLGPHIVETVVVGTEDIQSIGARSTKRVDLPSSGAIFASGQYFLQTGVNSTQITIDYNFGITLSLAPGFGPVFGTRFFFQLRAFDDSGVQQFFQNIVDYNPGDPLLLYRHNRFTGSVTYTVPANCKLFLDSQTSINGNNTFFKYDDDNDLVVKYTYTHSTTYIKALPPEYLYKQIIAKITGGEYQGESPILAAYHNIPVTCGDAIRGIPGAVIKTSLSDFFTSFNTQLDIGLGQIAGKVRLDSKAAFIDYSNPIQLGEVKELRVKVAAEYMVNTIKIGFPVQNYEDVNGRQEFNNTSQFTTPYTRISRELNLVSFYRGDCYGIEFTRINLDGKTTTDAVGDNDVFMVHTESTPYETNPAGLPVYRLDRSLNPSVSGVIEPQTIFNIYLSPKRALLRSGRYLHSLFYKLDGGSLVFQTTDKNAEMKTSVGPVVEKADLLIGSLAAPLFTPNLLEFVTPAPVDLVEVLEASPIRAFSFTYLGVAYLGIPVKVGIKAETLEAQEYSLLSAPTNNLEQRINQYE